MKVIYSYDYQLLLLHAMIFIKTTVQIQCTHTLQYCWQEVHFYHYVIDDYNQYFIYLQEENKIKVGQLTNELSEMSSQLMIKEEELKKIKEDNKLLVKQFRDRKKKRRETIAQVC